MGVTHPSLIEFPQGHRNDVHPHDPAHIIILRNGGGIVKYIGRRTDATQGLTLCCRLKRPSEEPAQEESEEALQVAQTIYQEILKRLPVDVCPD
jgi:hypothetical protein